jgi:hypothetical protein
MQLGATARSTMVSRSRLLEGWRETERTLSAAGRGEIKNRAHRSDQGLQQQRLTRVGPAGIRDPIGCVWHGELVQRADCVTTDCD